MRLHVINFDSPQVGSPAEFTFPEWPEPYRVLTVVTDFVNGSLVVGVFAMLTLTDGDGLVHGRWWASQSTALDSSQVIFSTADPVLGGSAPDSGVTYVPVSIPDELWVQREMRLRLRLVGATIAQSSTGTTWGKINMQFLTGK